MLLTYLLTYCGVRQTTMKREANELIIVLQTVSGLKQIEREREKQQWWTIGSVVITFV